MYAYHRLSDTPTISKVVLSYRYSLHTKTDTMLFKEIYRGSLQNKPSIKTWYCRPIVASVFQACIRAVRVLYRGRIGLVDAMNSGGIPDSCRKLHSVSVWNIGGIGHFPPEFIETSNRNGTSWLSVTLTRSGGIGINILVIHLLYLILNILFMD